MNPIHLAVRSVRARVGATLDMEAWASWAQIPHRGVPGAHVDGGLIHTLLGLRSKAWEPETFRHPAVVGDLGRDALRAASLSPRDVDVLVLVTCTPFEHMLGQDEHRFARLLGLRDSTPCLMIEAGCAGLARAVSQLSRFRPENALILSWTSASAFMVLPDGRPNSLYRDNTQHPNAELLWFSPALFSDGAAAVVLSRTPEVSGLSLYSRDATAEGGRKAFHDPLVVFPGGGAQHPPGTSSAAAHSAFGMRGDAIRRYYIEGMHQNHRELEEAMPGYSGAVQRIYTHQASPRLIEGFLDKSPLPREKIPTHCERVGNLVSASTLCLLNEDVEAGRVAANDLLCFSVVGAGPERGAFILPYLP